MPPVAVLFDFDGTLLDTESVALLTWVEEYRAHGLSLDQDAWIAAVGAETDHYATLARHVGPAFDLAACHGRRRGRENALVAAVEPADGIEAALTALAAAGTRLAVVSSSPATWVLPHLDRLGWMGRFEAVVTREDAARAKPHPDLYVMALARLGVRPHDVVAVEDSANGVRAAVAAGLRCVAMPNPVTAHHDLSLAISRCAPAGLLTALGLAQG
ncbi:MAG: hypothetical protein QOJ46_2779 [bacterium]|jgi:putative hydrolase of the HAD superfamily|nr:hypothetical protein [Frankiaceae bacterium]